ncbi:MAG: hypothetical protein II942_01970 [Alphaproteobacteria bacterium]|nr:hypothetical protein [Alphaproteobacteria bacterium]
MRKQLIRMLAIAGAIFNLSITQGHAEEQVPQKAHATISVNANGEAHNADYAEAEVLVTPKATAQIRDAVATYTGTFRKLTKSDGTTDDWQTYAHKVSVADDTWNLTFGRHSLRKFGGTTTATGFDNAIAGTLGRTFTGGFVGYKPYDLTIGLAATDGVIDPGHWNMLLASWSHRFDDVLGVHVFTGITKDHVEKAGLAIEYKPTDNFQVLLDGVYGKSKSVGLLAANYKLSDDVKLFAGSEVTIPDKGRTTGSLIGGVEGHLGHGIKLVGAVQQDLGHEHETKAVFGFKFNGGRDLL